MIVFCDLFDDSAAGALIEAVPILARRHAVIVAGVSDPDLSSLVSAAPQVPLDVYAAAAAIDLLDARSRAVALLARAGARVVEAPPDRFAAACVRAYVTAKSRVAF